MATRKLNRAPRKLRRDVNTQAEAAVRAITGSERSNGEDLLASPELRRQLREAKARAAKPGRTIKRAKKTTA